MAYLLSILLLLVPALSQDDSKSTSLKSEINRLTCVRFEKWMGSDFPLTHVVEYIRIVYGFEIALDEEAFRKAGVANIQDVKVNIPKQDTSMPLDLFLQLVLDQLKHDATLVVRGSRVVIVPEKPTYTDDRANCKWIQNLQKRTTEYTRGFPAQSAEKAVVELAKQANIAIYVRNKPFGRNVLTVSVKLKPMVETSYEEVLDAILAQLDAKALVKENYVLVIPRNAPVFRK